MVLDKFVFMYKIHDMSNPSENPSAADNQQETNLIPMRRLEPFPQLIRASYNMLDDKQKQAISLKRMEMLLESETAAWKDVHEEIMHVTMLIMAATSKGKN